MGRKTFESLLRPLPDRLNVVLTRNKSYKAKGVTVVHSVFEALEAVSHDERPYVIGGAEIYSLFMDFCSCIELTRVHRNVEGDTFFPLIPKEFVEVDREDGEEFSFIRLQLN